jgi:hypothetical protein
MFCHRHQARQPARVASFGVGLHVGSCLLSIRSILIPFPIFFNPTSYFCRSRSQVDLRIESYSAFCPPTQFDCVIIPQSPPDLFRFIRICVLVAGSTMTRLSLGITPTDADSLQWYTSSYRWLLFFIGWAHASSIFIILLATSGLSLDYLDTLETSLLCSFLLQF